MTSTGLDDGERALSGQGDPTLDERLELLANRTRRVVVSTLVDNDDERLPVDVLTDVVTRARADDVTTQSVLIDLHHVHLPKLERAGVLKYDTEAALVVYRGDAVLERCLRAIGDAVSD